MPGQSTKVSLTCPQCKSEFFVAKPSHAKRRKYCSRACCFAAKNMLLKCEHCHKEFSVRKCKKDRQCCSRKCAYERRIIHAYTCDHCGKPFQKRREGESKHCSRACYFEASKADFWANVEKSDGCWLWTGYKGEAGYGQFSLNGGHIPAHRHSYELHFGPVPPGLFVCHNCPDGDNPACVRPDHLFAGTHQDNMDDMIRKGRGVKGETQGGSKLTEAQVLQIRELYKGDQQQGSLRATDPDKPAMYQLAEQFGVSPMTICRIIQRKTWKHL